MFYSEDDSMNGPTISRPRSNTFTSFSQEGQENDNSSSSPQGSSRSPKLFINCVEIRQRSRSHSTSSFTRSTISLLTRNENQMAPPKTCGSPESMMSSTFPPPKRDLYGNEQAQSLPSYGRKFQQLGSHVMETDSEDATSEYNMDSNDEDESSDDMMDTESIDDEEIQFHMERRLKKRVTWKNENELVQCFRYKSDSRYYERNPFYGFGKIEYGSDDEDNTPKSNIPRNAVV